MKFRFIFIIIFIFSFNYSHSQGLMLKGNDYLIDERASFNVFEKIRPEFKEHLSIDFEIAPAENRPLGYIMRIIDEKSNVIYNILYDDYGEATIFKFNQEGKDILVTAQLDKNKLKENYWIKVSIVFDLKDKSAVLSINNEKFLVSGLKLQESWSPVIHFGRSEHIIDNLTFMLRNLKVGGRKKNYFFPLNEKTGADVHDSGKKIVGHVNNPVWLINRSYHWDVRLALHSDKVAGSNFDGKNERIYFFNEDSIVFYNIRTKDISSGKYINKCPMFINLGTNFIDGANDRIYVYEVSASAENDTTIAYLGTETLRWTPLSADILPTQLHHHSNYYDSKKREYIIFGGFGNLRYSDNFYSYKPDLNKWDTLRAEGDVITPRYFSSMGSSPCGNKLYIFGGMGNESGDQTVGRVYYYDLYEYDLETNIVKKMWDIPWKNENVVPVRNMVLTNDSVFYTLCYAEHFSNSFLRLYSFSVKDGSYSILGDSIPIISEKIKTNANLYYYNTSNELYCVVQEFENDDIASDVKVYSLLFPPSTAEQLQYYIDEKDYTKQIFFILCFCLLLAIVFLLLKKKVKRGGAVEGLGDALKEDTASTNKGPVPNSIYLFGDLTLYNRDGRDVSYMLSSKLCNAFLLILQHSISGRGISSNDFSEHLWPGKPEDKVKNSRGVTLNNLRKVLSEFNDVNLIYEKGKYKIELGENFYCDYKRCLEIIRGDKNSKSNIADIVHRGKFLKSLDDEFFDSFKGEVERELEPVLLIEAEKAYKRESYVKSVSLCDSVFNIDATNEAALSLIINSYIRLNNKNEAKRRYLLYATEYKQITGNTFEKEFSELVR